MNPSKKREVIEFLKAMPLPGRHKRNYLFGWAVTVGVRMQQREYNEVEATGTDR